MERPIKKTINGIDVYYIKSDKFKTITWSMVFTHEKGNDYINEYYFLSNILVDNMKKYPSNVLKYRYQSSLYGLDAFGSAGAIGNNIVNHFVITYPNEQYIPDEPNLSEKAFIFLNEMICNPSLRLGKFTKKAFDENMDEAKELYELMQSLKDMYSYYRFSKVFYQDKEDLQYNFPENDKLDKITIDSLTERYRDLFEKDKVSLFITGDFDEEHFDRIIEKNLNPMIINHNVETSQRVFPYSSEYKSKIIKEYDEVSQSRIYLGYLTNIEYFSKEHPALAVMNNIFGGFDQSKLFIEIRENNHLAYYVDSNYIADENMVSVSVSTSFDSEDKVLDQVQSILEEVKNGDFSDELFEQAKQNCILSLETINDSQIRYLLQHIKSYHLHNERYDLESRIKLYQEVTREDVIKAAKSLVLDTIYIYTKAGEKNA